MTQKLDPMTQLGIQRRRPAGIDFALVRMRKDHHHVKWTLRRSHHQTLTFDESRVPATSTRCAATASGLSV